MERSPIDEAAFEKAYAAVQERVERATYARTVAEVRNHPTNGKAIARLAIQTYLEAVHGAEPPPP
jgi:hypothetical protein